MGENAVGETLAAGLAEVHLNTVFLEVPDPPFDHRFLGVAFWTDRALLVKILEHGCQGLFSGHEMKSWAIIFEPAPLIWERIRGPPPVIGK